MQKYIRGIDWEPLAANWKVKKHKKRPIRYDPEDHGMMRSVKKQIYFNYND
jgi:hypothetical protein